MEIKGVFNSKIEQLFTVFFSSVKISRCRLRIKFDEDPLVVEENNYLTKTVNVSIVYDLDAWPKGPTSNFKFNKGLFGAANIVKNSDKEKYVYSGYRITFDSVGLWSFDNDIARNVISFSVDDSSPSHSENRKNNLFNIRWSPTFEINRRFGSPEKKFSINFAKANTKFCLSLHYNEDNSYLFVNGREILKFKANNKNVNFPTQFCLGIISSGFRASESTEVSLSGNVYDFSVDYSSTDKSDVLYIRIYLMVKNNI